MSNVISREKKMESLKLDADVWEKSQTQTAVEAYSAFCRAERNQRQYDKRKAKKIHCDVCEYDVDKYYMEKHNLSKRHLFCVGLKQKQKEEEVEKKKRLELENLIVVEKNDLKSSEVKKPKNKKNGKCASTTCGDSSRGNSSGKVEDVA